MRKRLVLIAAIIIVVGSAIYKNNFNHYLIEEKVDFIQTEPIAQKIKPADQQPETKPDKIVYKLEQRQYDEASNLVPSVDGELHREWLKQTAIFSIETLEDESILINDYLKQQGINKSIPDSITYCNGYPFIKYYEDVKSGKFAFVATFFHDESSLKYVYCGVAYSEDLKKEGSFVYDYDQGGKLLSEKFYNNQDEQVASISYTYNINVPFPIITNYDNSNGDAGNFFTSAYMNTGQRFWVYDKLLEFDENDRWVKYNGDVYNNLFSENGLESYNIPLYSKEGRLEKIVEFLRGSRYQDNPDEWIEDGEIEFKYSSSDSLVQVDYGAFSGNHGSSGNGGSVYYDEKGRVVHIDSFHSSGNYNSFYLYQNNEKTPFAIFEMGGMPYSIDEFDGYDLIFGMDFEAWFFLDK